MPVLESQYICPKFLRNGDLNTLYASLIRRPPKVKYQRERYATADGDFLVCDWSRVNSNKLAVLSHGLEGHSNRRYIRGMVKALNQNGWDAAAWNFRYCAGGPNNKLRMTHNGSTDDLDCILTHALAKNSYQEIALIGFSMGGNINLLHLGRNAEEIPSEVKKAVFISVPCDLKSCSLKLEAPGNFLYMKKFLRTMIPKIISMNELHQADLNLDGVCKIKSFVEFDDRFTGPMHGFKDAFDYYSKCSSISVMDNIKIPCLILSAKDDPFLTEECFPVKSAKTNSNIYLEMPDRGGHVGFVNFSTDGLYYSERRAMEFLRREF